MRRVPFEWAPLLCALVAGCHPSGSETDTTATTGETTGTTAGESGSSSSDTLGSEAGSSSGTGRGEELGEDATAFPIEVIGVCPEQGAWCATVTAHVEIDALPEGGDARLDVTIHNIVAPDSAQLLVNGEMTVPLSEVGVPPLRRRGGVVVAEVPLALASLREGDNTFTFSYRPQTDGVSGYRILDLVVQVADESLRPDLEAADPATWSPFMDDAEAIERGREFFTEVSRDGGPTCAACHVDSGADFEYFAFSNESIVRRAMFHEFTEADAQDIASFLRTTAVARPGQTFDPPFQPGEDNRGAVGAGWRETADDTSFGEATFGPGGLAAEVPWDFTAYLDLYRLPAPVQVPTWFRWLPRDLKDEWLLIETTFAGKSVTVGDAAADLLAEPSYANAWRLNSAAFSVGRQLRGMGEHDASIQVVRFAAVKLWEWSRAQDFELDHHGFPDEQSVELPAYAPPYPYEVGFAFFETAKDGGQGVAEPWLQAIEWWWVQLAVHDGRGLSGAQRPLNYYDVLVAADSAGLGPNALAFLHVHGSYEESRSAELLERFGTAQGSVRHLELAVAAQEIAGRVALWARFLRYQTSWLAESDVRTLEPDHLSLLADAWAATTSTLTAQQRDELRALAAAEALPALGG